MKIFIVADSMDIGGAETHIWELSRLLCVRGHAVTVFSSGGKTADNLSKIGVRHILLPSVQNVLLLPAAWHRLAEEIRLGKPHAVHAHTRRAALLCRLLSAVIPFPLTVTAHARFRADFPQRALSVFPNPTIAVSVDIRDHLVRRFSVPPSHIRTIGNGIDVERFSPAKEEIPPSEHRPFTILHVSRLDRDCTHTARLLIDIFPRLSRALGRSVRLVIVGGGESFEELSKQAEQAKCDGIFLLGARTDVPRLLQKCDVFVGVSRAALEAAATEKPVILSGDEGYLGLLTPRALPYAVKSNFCARGLSRATANRLLADLTNLSLLSKTARAALGRFGRQTVCQRYTALQMVKQTEAVYAEALSRFRADRRHDALLCGYYGYGNCGDGLILRHIIDRQRALSPHVRLAVLTPNGGDLHHARGVDRFSPLAVLRAMHGSGAFILGGGSLLQDVTSRRSLLYYLSLLSLAHGFGIPSMLYANGLGPLSPRSARLCRQVLSRVDAISLRDRRSYDAVCAMRLPHARIILGADPVLDRPIPSLPPEKRAPVLAFFPRGGGDHALQNRLADAVCELAKEKGLTVAVIPMNVREDASVARRLCLRMRQRGASANVDASYLAPLESRIGTVTLAVSERLHALILAFNAHTPAIGIARDPKIPSFLKDVGHAPCALDPSSVSLPSLHRAAQFAKSHPVPPQIRESLRIRAHRDAVIAHRLMMREGKDD